MVGLPSYLFLQNHPVHHHLQDELIAVFHEQLQSAQLCFMEKIIEIKLFLGIYSPTKFGSVSNNKRYTFIKEVENAFFFSSAFLLTLLFVFNKQYHV